MPEEKTKTNPLAILKNLSPIFAATASFPLIFYGMQVKSAFQLGKKRPSFGLRSIIDGIKGAPASGATVGTQALAQAIISKKLEDYNISENSKELASATLVAFASSPVFAALNGRTIGLGFFASMRKMSLQQSLAIVVRETCFLYSLKVSGPVSAYMKTKIGDNKPTEYLANFTTGAIGSIIGHIPDTALTCLQNQKTFGWVDSPALMKSLIPRAVTIGAFTALYIASKEAIDARKI